MPRTGRPPKWTKEQIAWLCEQGKIEPVYYPAKELGMNEATARYYLKSRGIPIIPRRQLWTQEDEALLRDLVGSHTIEEICKILVRPEAGVRCKAHKMGLSFPSTIRRPWTKFEDMFLYSAAEQMSLAEAGKALNRSKMSVWHRVSHLGIKWYQGRRSLTSVAEDLGCHPATVRKLCRKHGIQIRATRGGGMMNINDEHYQRILEVWFGPIAERWAA